MKRARIGCLLVLVLGPSLAVGEDIATPHPLARWGLAGMEIVDDDVGECARCSPGAEVIAPGAVVETAPPMKPIAAPPPVIGGRQLYILRHHYDRDPLPRKAWRWAHRSAVGF